MIEIKVYKTAEEAKKQLEKYEQGNKEIFEGFVERQGESASERLAKQTYFFVAELTAAVNDGLGKFYFESAAFPFLGWSDLHDDIQSLVQGVKNTVRHQTPKNIETVLYTIEDHTTENQECKKNFEEVRKIAEIYRSLDKIYENERDDLFKEEGNKMAEVLSDIGGAEMRGLTDQEREEFVRLYERS